MVKPPASRFISHNPRFLAFAGLSSTQSRHTDFRSDFSNALKIVSCTRLSTLSRSRNRDVARRFSRGISDSIRAEMTVIVECPSGSLVLDVQELVAPAL